MVLKLGIRCWLCEARGPERIFDLEMQLLALGWRHVREGEWLCRECVSFESIPEAPASATFTIGDAVVRGRRASGGGRR